MDNTAPTANNSLPAFMRPDDLPPKTPPPTDFAPTAPPPTTQPEPITPSTDTATVVPPPPAPPFNAAPKKKWGSGALVGVAAALILVVVSVVSGIALYRRGTQPLAPNAPVSQPQAAPSGTVLEQSGLRVTVVDVGPGNYISNENPNPGGQTDARSVPNNTLQQTYRIQNNRTTPITVKLFSYDYMMYRIGTVGTARCTDLYTPAQINSFVSSAGGGSTNEAYRQFAERFYADLDRPSNAHCYDNEAVGTFDPSGGQTRIIPPSGAGGLSCSYLQSISENRCADSQTLVSKGNTAAPYLISTEEVTVAPGEEKGVTFSLSAAKCGFYQFDHGLLINGTEPFWTGSEIKFFTCPASVYQCQAIQMFRGSTQIQTSDIRRGDSIVFRGFATATDTTVSKIKFTLTKGGVAQTPVEVNATLVGNQYQADYTVLIDQSTSYAVKAEAISP